MEKEGDVGVLQAADPSSLPHELDDPQEDDEIRIPEAEEVDDVEINCTTESAKVAQIIDEMSACIDADIESNNLKRPALKKLSYSKKLQVALKDFKVQELFLDLGG